MVHRYRVDEAGSVIARESNVLAIPRNHPHRTNGVEVVSVETGGAAGGRMSSVVAWRRVGSVVSVAAASVMTTSVSSVAAVAMAAAASLPDRLRPYNLKDPLLTLGARGRLAAIGAVVIKERIQPSTEDNQILRTDNPKTPSHLARDTSRHTRAALGKIGILEGRNRREGHAGRRIGLIVRGLGLDLGQVDVPRVDELVLVQNVVLGSRTTDENAALLGLDEDSAPSEDGDLRVVGVLEVVVGHPDPAVLVVEASGGLGDVKRNVRGDALLVDDVALRGSGGALRELEVRPRETANADVNIPHARGLAGRVQVPLDELGACRGTAGRNDGVRPLDAAFVASVADTDDGAGLVDVGELGASADDDGCEGFADDAGAGGDGDGVSDDVGACIDEGDEVSAGDVGEKVVESGGGILEAVSTGAEGADGDKLRGGDVGIGGLKGMLK